MGFSDNRPIIIYSDACTYNNIKQNHQITHLQCTVLITIGVIFFSQNVFNSFSTIENWMGVMALSIYFGKTSIWMGRDNSFQIKITCKPKLCRNSQKLILCIITQIIKNIQKAFGYTFELETTQWRRGNHCSRNFKILSKNYEALLHF